MNLAQGSPWHRYCQWWIVMWISLTAFFLVPAVASESAKTMAMALAFVPLISSIFALRFFKCPRCHKTFFGDNMLRPFEGNCLHCHLPKWKEADYVGPAPSRSIAEMASNTASDRNANFLTLVLRDDPGAIHLSLDSDGWADVTNLLTRANRYGFSLTREVIAEVMAMEKTGIIEWDQSANRIRACR